MVAMSNVSVSVRLRPIRFAFLVPPDRKKAVSDIFRINSCLWGGKYNPIIPFLRQVPKWWDRDSLRSETALEIMNGYLDFFEPDFLVEAEPNLASRLGFGDGRVIGLSDFPFISDDSEQACYGLDTFDVYRKHFHETFQFSRRNPGAIVEVEAAKSPFSLFSECVFGAFPRGEKSVYLAQAFREAFEPTNFLLKNTTLASLYETPRVDTPLTLGSSFLKVQFDSQHKEPILFFLDASEPRDLLDYWNLRAIRRRVIPIPVQWLADLSTYCKAIIADNYKPLPGNPYGLMKRTVLMFSRSIPKEAIQDLMSKHLDYGNRDATSVNCCYPQFWRRTPEYVFRETRPTISCAETTADSPIDVDNANVRVPVLHPMFVASSPGFQAAWANVVRIRDWTGTDQFTTVFPSNYKNPEFPNLGFHLDPVLPTTEGLVVFPKHRNVPFIWKLQQGSDAVNSWLATQGVKATISDGGRRAQQVIQTLGGLSGVRSIANKGIVELLNKISRSPISHSVHHQKFRNEVNKAVQGSFWKDKTFELLVEKGAVELGLELRCTRCLSWSWYSLKELDHSIKCNLCLRQFGFPITEPGNSKLARWAYRVVGPFALPDYAKGGYAASLAIRFFAEIVGSISNTQVTWSTGQEIELSSGRKIETDFIIWYQRTGLVGNDYPTQVVFGEAKSFGKDALTDDDIEALRLLAGQFPGSILAFATMKQAHELSKEEVRRLTKLAEWGRKRDRCGSRAPFLILTGTELFAEISLESTWRELGGQHASLIEPAYISTSNLNVIADLTQQINLKMPSYSEWRTSKDVNRKRKLLEKL